MSDPQVAQPPTSPPPNDRSRSRTPWVVATVAAVVALAAIIALVAVLVARDDEGGSGGASDRGDSGSERGFDSPEEAVTFLVERLAGDDPGEAAEAFAVEPLVEGYSFEAHAERLRAVTFQTWLPDASGSYDEINEDVRRGEVAVELRSLVRALLAPERDQNVTTTLDDDLTAQDLAGELSPDPLSELALVRVDEIDRSEPAYLKTLEQQGAVYGADEVTMVGMLLDSAEGQVMGGATLVRYDDQWAVMSLSAPLLNVPLGRLVSSSEQDYQEALESARGSDG